MTGASWMGPAMVVALLWLPVAFTDGAAHEPVADPAAVDRASIVGDSLVVRELQPGVWLHTSWRQLPGGADVPKNGLVVLEGEELWLLDTAWGNDLTGDLLRWLDREIGMPVAGAIVTHFHDDSMGGVPALDDRGIPVWGHPLTIQLGADEGVALPQSFGELNVGESTSLGGMEVFYPGPAHTPDNVMVWIPGARILFGTCAVRPASSSTLGNVADADLSEWRASIRRARNRFPEVVTVVPSHGPPGDGALLEHTMRLFDMP